MATASSAIRVSFKVEGIDKLVKKLRKFPINVQNRVIKNVLRVGTTPLLKEAKKLAPVGKGLKPGGASRPHLRDSIARKIKAYKGFKGTGTVVAIIGIDAKKAPHQNLVTGGVKPHRIPGAVLVVGGRVVAVGVDHPGHKANDFLERAANRSIPKMRTKIRTQLAKRLAVEAKKL